MNITIINGSPKLGKSTSALLIDNFVNKLNQQEVQIYNISQKPLGSEELKAVAASDVLLFAFPLYIDSIPSHLLKQLQVLEKLEYSKSPLVYCIVNNGFYEGWQNRHAVKQMKLWCGKAGLVWGQGLGVGTGEMLPFIADIPMGHGPNKNLGIGLDKLAANLEAKSSGEDLFISINWPRFIWKIQACTSVWFPMARKNKVKIRNMRRKLVKENRQ